MNINWSDYNEPPDNCTNQDNVICPYCGYKDDELCDYNKDQTTQCNECGRWFLVTLEVTVEYTTWPKKDGGLPRHKVIICGSKGNSKE